MKLIEALKTHEDATEYRDYFHDGENQQKGMVAYLWQKCFLLWIFFWTSRGKEKEGEIAKQGVYKK